MATTHARPEGEGGASYVAALDDLVAQARRDAEEDPGDRRRQGLLRSLGALLEQPRRAAEMLAEHDGRRRT